MPDGAGARGAEEPGEPEGPDEPRRGFSLNLGKLSNYLNPIQKKRVGRIKDVAFEKVEGTKKYLADIDGEVRSKLYREYNQVIKALAPDLRNMGRSTGKSMLETLYIPMNDPVEKKWREDLGYLGVYPEFTQKVVNPILQPFCDGLWEPFDGFIWSFKMEMFTYIALSGAAGLLAGYAIGRCKKDR
mmetsp:Transcript_3095/g.10708  ORF Transcript_3095/g.10708 Transcript_3095/m.10708 type:complete len:186 (+) Transcript_3095:43-600(+)